MIEGNDLTETSIFAGVESQNNADMNDWVAHSEDIRFGGNGSVEIKIDDSGREYAEWRNGDFGWPYTKKDSSVQERTHFYAS